MDNGYCGKSIPWVSAKKCFVYGLLFKQNSALVMEQDVNIWEKTKKEDLKAFKSMYLEHVDVLYNYGKQMTSKNAVIEDCIQEVHYLIPTLMSCLKRLRMPLILR